MACSTASTGLGDELVDLVDGQLLEEVQLQNGQVLRMGRAAGGPIGERRSRRVAEELGPLLLEERTGLVPGLGGDPAPDRPVDGVGRP